MADVIMPQMGESIFEGTITKWLKKPGDKIERDEPLFEISTDKVDAEIPSPSAGVLKEIKVNEGQTVPIQTVVAVIDADGASASAGASAAASAPAPAPAKTEAPAQASAPPRTEAAPKPAPPPAPSAPRAAAPSPAATSSMPSQRPNSQKIRSSPLVRRIARENNVDLSQIPGTGAGGRISKHDIRAAIEGGAASGGSHREVHPAFPAAGAAPARAASVPPPAAGGAAASAVLETAVPREKMYFGQYEVQPMSVMRQRIAEHMVLSKRVSPHVYSVDEVNVSGIAAVRSKLKDKFEQSSGTKLTFMPFFVRAAVEGLRAFPTVNSSVDGTNMRPAQRMQHRHRRRARLGLDRPGDQERRRENFLGIARALNDLAERARAKKLKPEEVAESTFSIAEFRRLRRPLRPAHHQPAQRRHPRPRHNREAPGGCRRRDRDPLDGLPHALLRPSRCGRRRSASVYG